MWRIHFEGRPSLKNKTLEIYEALHDLTEQSLAKIEALTREVRPPLRMSQHTHALARVGGIPYV